MLTNILTAFSFLTRIPIQCFGIDTKDVGRSTAWFPLVGTIIGLSIAQIYIFTLHYWSNEIAAILAVIFGLILTGGLHEDGATDVIDGIGGGWNNKQVLDIMHDSRIGAYGAMMLWCLLTLRWSILIFINHKAIIILPLAMTWSRWSIVVTIWILPSISTGISSIFKKNITNKTAITASIITVVITTVMIFFIHKNATIRLFYSLLTSGTTALLWIVYVKKRFGGQNGDLLGAGSQLVEAVALLTLCININ